MAYKFIYVIFTASFFTNSISFGMVRSDFLDSDEESAKEILKKMGNVYHVEPKINDPLDEGHVSNEYWQNISSKDQKIKNDELAHLLKLNFNGNYPLQRRNIAAAVRAGANPNITYSIYGTALCVAALFHDFTLCELLFEHGADPDIKEESCSPVIFSIKKCDLANLFLKYGAHIDGKDSIGDTILSATMHPNFEAPLISLYKSKGISPLYANKFGFTVLHRLAFQVTDYNKNLSMLHDKISALFEGLIPNEALQLINARYHFGETSETVFDILKAKNDAQHSAAKALMEHLQSIHDSCTKSTAGYSLLK